MIVAISGLFLWQKPPEIEPAPEPEVYQFALQPHRNPLPDIKTYAQLRAIEIGVNPNKFTDLIWCESGWNEEAIGDSGKAFGLLQFWKKTFDEFSKTYKLKGDYTNSYDQIDLALLMLHDGYSHHWKNCSRIIDLE